MPVPATITTAPWDAAELALFTERASSESVRAPARKLHTRRIALTLMALALVFCLLGLVFLMDSVNAHHASTTAPALVIPASPTPPVATAPPAITS
jgi:hypothetical protein